MTGISCLALVINNIFKAVMMFITIDLTAEIMINFLSSPDLIILWWSLSEWIVTDFGRFKPLASHYIITIMWRSLRPLHELEAINSDCNPESWSFVYQVQACLVRMLLVIFKACPNHNL